MHYSSASTRRFHFSIANGSTADKDSASDDELRVVEFTLYEYLSDLFALELDFISENHYLSPDMPWQAAEADRYKPGQSFKPIIPEAAYQLSKFDFASKTDLSSKKNMGQLN
jgi:hypothetical protein